MDAAGYIQAFRGHTGDQADPLKWSDEEIVNQYLNAAVDEACERADLIEDTTTAACCEIELEADKGVYALHASVLKVSSVKLNGRQLSKMSIEELDATAGSSWEDRTGLPHAFVVSNDGRTLQVYPKPAQAGVLKLRVFRTQLEPFSISSPNVEPQIRQNLHLKLLDWMYRCAYLKPDADTLDTEKSRRHELIFEASFGPSASAAAQRNRRDARPRVVQMNRGW